MDDSPDFDNQFEEEDKEVDDDFTEQQLLSQLISEEQIADDELLPIADDLVSESDMSVTSTVGQAK